VWFQKISIPPPRRVIGNFKGEGGLKGQTGKYEPKLEFPEGWGVQTEKTLHGGVWIFSGTTQFLQEFKFVNGRFFVLWELIFTIGRNWFFLLGN